MRRLLHSSGGHLSREEQVLAAVVAPRARLPLLLRRQRQQHSVRQARRQVLAAALSVHVRTRGGGVGGGRLATPATAPAACGSEVAARRYTEKGIRHVRRGPSVRKPVKLHALALPAAPCPTHPGPEGAAARRSGSPHHSGTPAQRSTYVRTTGAKAQRCSCTGPALSARTTCGKAFVTASEK